MYMKQINGGDRILSSTLIKMSLYSLYLKINYINVILLSRPLKNLAI